VWQRGNDDGQQLQPDWLIFQVIPQHVTVVVDVTALARNRHTLQIKTSNVI
jgi:hypothetical protein